MQRRNSNVGARIGIFLFVLALCAFSLFPFALMASTSLKPPDEVLEPGFRMTPKTIVIENYIQVFEKVPLFRFLLNGVIVTGAILAGQLLVTVPAAYAFAKLDFPLKRFLFSLVLAALVFPRYITAIPNFLLFSKVGAIDTYAALVLPSIGSAMGIFLLRQFLLQVPWSFFEAARLDGCGTGQMIVHVLLPLIRPAVGAFSIFSVVAHWNDLFWPIIVVNSSEMFTPPAGIVFFADMDAGTTWGSVMAAGVVVITPLVGLFLATRRQFISSLSQVSMK